MDLVEVVWERNNGKVLTLGINVVLVTSVH